MRKLGAEKLVRECYKHSIQSELKYRIEKFLNSKHTVSKQVQDYELELDYSRSGLEKDLYLHSIREEESVNILKSELKQGMNVVDIGSNIGYYAFMEAETVGDEGKVLAIEPTTESFERFLENLNRNNYSNIDYLNKAAGNKSAKLGVRKYETPNLNRIVSKERGQENVDVEPLDKLAEGFNPDLVRMDVEGYELNILEGMEEILARKSLTLFLEVHPRKISRQYKRDIDNLWSILSENNFKVKYLIRHPMKAHLSYFFRKPHPPRVVHEPDKGVYETLEEYSEFFQHDRNFRIFLEKK